MKKIILLTTLALLTACSCKTKIDRASILSVEQTTDKKLPTLKAVYIDATSAIPQYWEPGSKIVQSGTERATLFYNLVENTLTNPYGDIHGYMELRDETRMKPGLGLLWLLPSYYTCGLGNLLGLPWGDESAYSQVNVRILDKKGRLVKRYQTRIDRKEYWARWSECSEDLPLRVYRMALDKIISDMQQDYDYLYDKLK